MRRILKDQFIPHEGNAYQPYFLRFKVAFLMLLMVLTLESAYLVGTTYILPRSDNFAAIFASVLIEQTNTERTTDKLGTLTVNSKLENAARLKAQDMAEKGYFAHNTPDGKTPWYFFREAGYDYAAAGENLAVNFTDSKDVTEAWMRSPSHRANIMNGEYTEIGIATANGTYKGKSAIFVVQEFGRPSIVARDIPDATTSASNLLASISNASPSNDIRVEGAQVAKPVAFIPQSERAAPVTVPTVAPRVTMASEDKPQTTLAPMPTSSVAGEDTTKLGLPEESLPVVTSTPEPLPNIDTKPSAVERIIASPRSATTSIFLVLASVIIFALGLAIFIKIRIQYPHMIANAILLVAIILAIVLLNFALGFTQGVI